MLVGQTHDGVGGLDAFHNLADFGHRLFQRHATAEREAEAAVARQVAGTGQRQVAEAGQTHQRFGARAELRQPRRSISLRPRVIRAGAGVEAELHAVGDAGGDGEDVFHRAAEFGADHVGAGVGAESA